MKAVTKEEFEQFITTYPRPLDRDVSFISEPPVVTYNDFSLGDWPASIVARHSFDDLMGIKPSGWEVKETA
jgi:hypothetical protein